jgi:signal transduction histidine kinase
VLELWVVDDGVGEDPRAVHRDGVGLGNTRARLRSLYGGDHRFEASGKPNEGFTVRMEIPFRVVALAPTAGAAHD